MPLGRPVAAFEVAVSQNTFSGDIFLSYRRMCSRVSHTAPSCRRIPSARAAKSQATERKAVSTQAPAKRACLHAFEGPRSHEAENRPAPIVSTSQRAIHYPSSLKTAQHPLSALLRGPFITLRV
jgi:hypothetical protein